MNEINYEKIQSLTKELIHISSINGKAQQEKNIASFIYDFFKNIPYFKQHNKHLLKVNTTNDEIERQSIIALYKKENIKDTIILMGHLDTVDIEDYGNIKEYATDPDKLPQKLQENFELDQEIIEDIKSDKYLFARGSLDMKAGLANQMLVFKYFIEHSDELNVNLLFLAECDEEDNSHGIISSLRVLSALKDEEDLNYISAINADFTTPQNKDDKNHYIYLGTVGKILPCFMCFGKEAHAGSPFQALDPNYLISLINKNMSYNAEFCDYANKECSVPPISLRQSDTKDKYTVQTALSAYTCFNYMLHSTKPDEVMEKCLKVAESSFEEAISNINSQYEQYCQKANIAYHKLNWQTRVYSFEQWYRNILNKKDIRQLINDYAREILKEKIDLRLFCVRLIQKIREFDDNRESCVIVFFGSMFYANIEIKGENSKERKLIDSINEIVKKSSDKSLKVRYFYPYISDMSFLNTNLNEEEITKLLNNSPMYPYNYDYPYEDIKNISMPVVNIGTHGKDGHMLSERLEKDYCFKTLPELLYLCIKELGK